MAGAGRLDELEAELTGGVRRFVPPGPVAVALSGGADSAAAAWAVLRCGRDTRLVHVDHGLAGSPGMRAAAERVAAALERPLAVTAVEIPAGPSPEAMARDARYAALAGHRGDGEWVVLAHTADDQAETVLGNLLRGAGAAGLSGMSVRRGPWVRPLLEVPRAHTRELAGIAGLPFADDPANLDQRARRNVLRRDLIPDLEERFNPGLRAALVRTAAVLSADDDLLEGRAAAVPLETLESGIALPAPLLAVLPRPIAARAVRRALRAGRGPHPGMEREVAAVLDVAAGVSAAVTLSAGFEARREGARVVLTGGPATPPISAPVDMTLPGSMSVPGLRLEATVAGRAPAPWPLGTGTVVLDADAVGTRAVIRPAGAGERMEMTRGHKEVRRALAEAGVPARLRPGWPVLAAHGKLAWLAGVRAAAWARPTAATKSFLTVTMDMAPR